MDAIRSYIENVFANLPKTNDVLRAKNDMLDNMEEKYREFKDQGYSENEAVGKVISEFGNMDELIAELDVQPAGSSLHGKKTYQVSKKEAEDWMMTKKRMGLFIAIGVFLCIFGVILLLLKTAVPYTLEPNTFNLLGEPNPAVGITLMLSMVAIAVGLFIFSGMKLDRFDFMEKDFELNDNSKKWVMEQRNKFMRYYTFILILGVILCILAPLVLILPMILFNAQETVSILVVGMLFIISIAAFIFSYFGNIKEAYDKLLKKGDYQEGQDSKIVAAVSSVIWPLAMVIFFMSGFLGGHWSTAWIVFPITAVLFAAFRSIAKVYEKK